MVAPQNEPQVVPVANDPVVNQVVEQILKGLLAKNYAGVNYMLAHLMDEEHAAKTSKIYAKAQVAATGDFERLSRLQEAWQAVNTLPADATPDAKVDAAHRLIVEIVRAFRV